VSQSTERRDTPEETALLIYSRAGLITVPLPEGATHVVGRESPADVVVEDASLSRTHARFVHEPGGAGVFVEDLGSTNGTVVRGAKITRTSLRHGMEVRLGDVVVVVQDAAREREEGGLLEEHGDFLGRVDEELVRSRSFGRSMALLVLSSKRGAAATKFAPSVQTLARHVDHFGFYASSMCLLLMPETSREQALAFANGLDVMGISAGIAIGPREGTSSAELLERAVLSLRGEDAPESLRPQDGIVASKSPAMSALLSDLARIAPTKLTVILYGETGSGKDVLARHVHKESGLTGEFRAINCGAIVPTLMESTLFGHEKGAFTGAARTHKGIFEQAHRGTVFLDEIGELPPSAQVALLRVLEARTIQRVGTENDIVVDVRVIGATHKNLEKMVAEGTFRQDLLYRLDGFSATVPPLRDRPQDLRGLVKMFLREANARHGRAATDLTPLAWELLASYSFPGNVRELRNVIERAVVLAREDRIDVRDFPERMRSEIPALESSSPAKASPVSADTVASVAPGSAPGEEPVAGDLRERVKRYEHDLLREALRAAGGNRAKAAEALQIPIRTLFNKLRELDPEP